MSKLFTVPAAAREALDAAIIADLEESYREFAKQRGTMGRFAKEPRNSLSVLAYGLDYALVTNCVEASGSTWHDVQFVTEAERARYIKSRIASLYKQGKIARSLGLDYNGREAYLYEPLELPTS